MGSWGSSAAPAVEDLESFQRKSAAIETIFTLAVLYVSVLQILSPSGLWQYLALIPVGILLVLAIVLGGENLWNQLRAELSGD